MKAAFIFLAPQADGEQHRTCITTPAVTLTAVGVKNHAEAAAIAKTLVNEGVATVEFCGGFGNKETSRIRKAVKGEGRHGSRPVRQPPWS